MKKLKKYSRKIESHSQQIGGILRQWMLLNSLSEAALARAADLAKPTLRNYLDGRLITVNLETLEKVCRVLKRSLPELMEQSSAWKGFIKTDSAIGKFNISNLNKYRISIECDIPLNAHLAGGYIHFYPKANYLRIPLKATGDSDEPDRVRSFAKSG